MVMREHLARMDREALLLAHSSKRHAVGTLGAALIVGVAGIGGRGLDHRFQPERTAGVLEEDARTVEGAFLDMGEAAADFRQQLRVKRHPGVLRVSGGQAGLRMARQ